MFTLFYVMDCIYLQVEDLHSPDSPLHDIVNNKLIWAAGRKSSTSCLSTSGRQTPIQSAKIKNWDEVAAKNSLQLCLTDM